MKLPDRGKFRWNYPALAFALPMSMMLALMFVTSALPFGEYSLYYYSDEFHQYFPFFKAFRQALRSGQSILWNWDVGLGMDYLGLISYYLASPLNLFSVLIPDAWVEEYFALLMPVKLSLASMFFAIFLKKLFQKDDLSIVLFGFTCLISFYTYAERASVYIFGEKSKFIVKVIWVIMIFVGSQTTLGFAWDLADTINGLMIIPNLIGLLLLSNQVVKLKKEYFADRLPARKH